MNKKIRLIISLLLICSLLIFECASTKIHADEVIDKKLDNNLVDKMFCGFDVTAGHNLMEGDALKLRNPIIDRNSNYRDFITVSYNTADENKSFISDNIKTENSEYAKHISGGVFGNIFVIDVDMEASFAKSDKLSKVRSERYEIYSMYKEYCRYFVERLRVEDYKDYLSPNFKEDLYKVDSKSSAKQLFDEYGTHLITGYIFGGRMDVTNYMATSSEEHDLRTATNFSEKMNAFIKKVSAGEKASFEEEVASVETDSETISLFDLRAYGGEGGSMASVSHMFTYSNVVIDNGDGNSSNAARYNYQRWTDSIDRGVKLAIVGIPENGNAMAIPLWELLDYSNSKSIEIRELLIDEFIERCGDEYSKYLEKYAPQAVTPNPVVINFDFPTMNGVYIRTSNDYYYYIDSEDLMKGHEHYGVHKGDKVYLDLDDIFEDNVEVMCTNGSIIDGRAGIFKVDDVSGNFVITVKNNKGEKRTYINVPIQNSIFEGGMGTEKYPYIIVNKDQFKRIMNNNYSSFQLQRDIDFEGEKLTCFGEFGGTLDGNYCKIENFIIEAGKDYGLFSKITADATVKNLGIFNAGSSTNSLEYSTGGLNYGEDYENENYTVNSIEALNAGIVCGVNNGIISNCYIQDCYIRDIIKNTDSYEDTFRNVNMCIGGIAGRNSGEISDCMVNNIQLLGSYIYTKDDKNSNIYVYSGALVGELCSGTIRSCVADQGINGTIMSQIINEYSGGIINDPDYVAKAYSTGLIGYCDGTAIIKDSYCYVRNVNNNNLYPSVASEFYSTDWTINAEIHQAYANATIICGDNSNVTVSNSYAYSDNKDIEIRAIRPIENCKKSTDQENFTILQIFEARKLDSSLAFDSVGLNKASFDYNPFNNGFSGVTHILSKNRSEYIKIYLDTSDDDSSEDDSLKTDVYRGTIYNLHGIKLKKSINSEKTEDLPIFNVKVIDVKINVDDDKYRNMTDRKLFSTDLKKYQLVFSVYNGEIKENNTYLNVRDKNIIGIEIKADASYSTRIYYDEVEDYFNSWSTDKIKIIKLMTDGTREEIGKSDKSKIHLAKNYNEIGVGENSIIVEYDDGIKKYTSSYIVNVEKRKLISVELSEPEKTEYNVGEVFDISGMTMTLKYDKGNPNTKLIKLDKDDENIEIINGTIVKGDNKIAVAYKDYKTVGYVTVYGKNKDNSNFSETTNNETTKDNEEKEPTSEPTPDPTSEPTLDPTLEPTPTPVINPKPDEPINPVVVIVIVMAIAFVALAIVYSLKHNKGKKISVSNSDDGENADKNDNHEENGDD